MAMVEKEKVSMEEGTSKNAPVYKIYPDIYRHVDYQDKSVQIEVSLPGVRKTDIIVKALPTWFHLSAMRPGENVEYTANVNFGVEIAPEETTAEYSNGLLKIRAKISDPLDHAKEVSL